MNLGTWKARINDWMGETIRDGILTDASNDAIEELWMAAIRANLSLMMGGPVTLTVAAGTERQQLVSIVDPVAVPTVQSVVQGALLARNVVCAYTIVTDSGSETNMSPTLLTAVLINNLLQQLSPARVPSAVGWNCYMGSSVANLGRQNLVPIPFGQSFLEPNTGAVDAPDSPLPPTENSTADDIFYIRHMEVNLSSGGYKKWEQSDIDGQLFQEYSRRISSTSEYQNYAFDLVNQRQLEIRPVTGLALTPRYFYVHKPRRLRFPASQFPFFNFPSEPFLRAKTMALCHAANRDWDDAKEMGGVAAGLLLSITSTISQMNWGKDMYVQPYMR